MLSMPFGYSKIHPFHTGQHRAIDFLDGVFNGQGKAIFDDFSFTILLIHVAFQ